MLDYVGWSQFVLIMSGYNFVLFVLFRFAILWGLLVFCSLLMFIRLQLWSISSGVYAHLRIALQVLDCALPFCCMGISGTTRMLCHLHFS